MRGFRVVQALKMTFLKGLSFKVLKFIIYNLLFAPVFALMLPGFLLRMFKRGGYRARILDRFAIYPKSIMNSLKNSEGLIWIHAVSVGEVQVAGQLMREWRKRDNGIRFCFSTTSSTGWKMAEKEVSDRDILIYNPLDFPTFVKAAFATVKPRAIVLTESEIWPNFIRRAAKLKIPAFLINARVSDRSAPRYKLGKIFFKDIFRCFTRIFAQSELDKSRLIAAGALDDLVEVTGSFKFDVARKNEAKEIELKSWLKESLCLPKDNKILLGGSTWPGEDEALLKILDKLPNTTLIIAPRHFEKADVVEENILKAGYSCYRRSTGIKKEPDNETKGTVFLADTTGELMGLYAIADIVFVGKSLCAHGSQNMIEPCFCGKPTVVGPYTENFRPVMSDLLEQGGICQVADYDELERTIIGWVTQGDDGLGECAAKAVKSRTGVVLRCVNSISNTLTKASCENKVTDFNFLKAALYTVFFIFALSLLLGGMIYLKYHSEKTSKAVAVSSEDTASISTLKKEKNIPKPKFIRIASVYAAALSKPNAKNVLVKSDDKNYSEIFNLIMPKMVSTNESNDVRTKYDIVFVEKGNNALNLAEIKEKVSDNGILVNVFSVAKTKSSDFKNLLQDFPGDDVRLWMFSKTEWMIVGMFGKSKVKMLDMLDFFSREGVISVDAENSGAGSIQDVFASYAAKREAVMPVFTLSTQDFNVAPQYFLSEKIPPFDWIDPDGVDADIVESISSLIYERQYWRRIIVKAEEVSLNKNTLDQAIEMWTEAMKENSSDTMLLDRLYRMAVNAKVFKDLGKFADAAYCYEMMLAIRPEDKRVGEEYVKLLQQLGKRDFAETIQKKLKSLNNKSSEGKGSRYDVE